MIAAYLLVLVAVGLLMAAGGSWSPWARRNTSPRYLRWATVTLLVAALIVFAEHRIARGFVFLAVTAAVGVLAFVRYREN